MKTANRTGKKCGNNLELPFEKTADSRIHRGLSHYLSCSVEVDFTDNAAVMISFKKKKGGSMKLRLHHMFRAADENIIKALAGYLQNRDSESSLYLNNFIKSNKNLVRKHKKRPGKIEPCGKCYELEPIFNRINRNFFNNETNAAITWGKRNGRKAYSQIRLGSYSYADKLIRIHPALDKKWVPEFFIESIVYHEMLHAFFQVTQKNGRKQYHTHEFREYEKKYPKFEQARVWEKQNIHRLI